VQTANEEDLAVDIFQGIARLLDDGESFVLALIVSRSGSAPRAVGTRMVVRSNGSIMGTIGGGILEAQVQELAMDVFNQKNQVLKEFIFSAQDATQMGMICGGEVKVLVRYVDALQSFNCQLYQGILGVSESRKRAWLVTEISSSDEGTDMLAQCLVRSDGTQIGELEGSAVHALTSQVGLGQPEIILYERTRFLVESLCHEGTVYIFGAGHISQELAPLTRLVGFRTVVLDDRLEFANRERFPIADEVIVLDSFDRAMHGLEINEESYLVLVTRGHAHDKTVLEQALGTSAGYIGMIGSRRKRDAIYEALKKEGYSHHQLESVYSPIGLEIAAETPEEIAVSIVAELIQARAKKIV